MALGENMKRKTLIPTSSEDLMEHNVQTETLPEITVETVISKPVEIIQEVQQVISEPVIAVKEEIKETPNKQLIETNSEVTIEFKPSLRTKVNKINVILTGKLTIYNIAFIKEKIDEICFSYSTVEFLLKNTEDLDITFIQYAYHYIEHKKAKDHLVTFDVEKPSNQLITMLNLNNYTDLFIRKKLA